MKAFTTLGLIAASALMTCGAAQAASYSASYTAGPSAQSGFVSDPTGTFGQTLNVGDSVTVSFSAPSGKAFQSAGGFMFDYQLQDNGTGGATLTEDVTYTFYNGAGVLATGSVNGAVAQFVDLRLPVFTTPIGTWTELVYTTTLDSFDNPVVLQNGFSYDQSDAVYVNTSAVPEGSSLSLMLAALAAGGLVVRRRRASV